MKRAFTLFETILVVVIVALLASSPLTDVLTPYQLTSEADEINNFFVFLKKGQNYSFSSKCNMKLSYDQGTNTLTWSAPTTTGQASSVNISDFTNTVYTAQLENITSTELLQWDFPWIVSSTGQVLLMNSVNTSLPANFVVKTLPVKDGEYNWSLNTITGAVQF